ncbi:MAG: ABC transporter ATP-binding protein [Chitinophagaceae bacterium]|nr:ABC transporter ATP-binding protein [Chitinophagaceae bacterium]
MPSSEIIKVENLSKQFSKINAVNNISFTVNKGDIYGFLGQNGAGKSTTIRMLLTLIQPTSGSIKIFGKDLQHNKKVILKNIGAIIEKPDVYKFLTAYQNLKIFAELSGCKVSRELLMSQLEMVGLGKRAHDVVKTFSQGMKQRLGIAIALVHNPELVILDEPTNGLDPQGIADIRNLIKSLSQDYHKTVLISSHLLNEIEQVATRILIIDKGKKIIEGTKQELLDPNQTIVEFETTDAEKAREIIIYSKWNSDSLSQFYNNISLSIPYQQIPSFHKYLVENGIPIFSFHQRNSLEDYFIKVTKEQYAPTI